MNDTRFRDAIEADAPAQPRPTIVVPQPTTPTVSGKVVPTRKLRTKIEPWMANVVAQAILNGQPFKGCAGLIGVSVRTMQNWRELGQDPKCSDPLLADFAYAVEEACSTASKAGVQVMQIHAMKDWRAQLEILRAQDPETWSPQSRKKVEVEHSLKGQQRDLSNLSNEELEQLEMLENKAAAAKALPA